MRPKLIVIFLLLVLGPLALLGWLGTRLARQEQEMVQHRFRELLLSKLRDTESVTSNFIQERERELLRVTSLPSYETASLRELVRTQPLVRQVFLADPAGKRLHPPIAGPLNASEQAFLGRTQSLWNRGLLREFVGPPEENPSPASPERSYGWYAWHWDDGPHLIFWRREASGQVLGVEIDRVRLLSDLVGKLPDTRPDPRGSSNGRIALADAKGNALYQWGVYEPAKGEAPRASLPLAPPLDALSLAIFVPKTGLDAALGRSGIFSLVSGLLVLAIAFGSLAVYLYREYSKEMREAAQRVSFVNQVSHELKTPLTNIRMYAELLDNRLPDEDEKTARYLKVIVSESQRLSRLIGNILTFGQKQKDKLKLHPTPGNVDEVIRSVLEQFRLSMEEKGIKIVASCNASGAVNLDADALRQILGNLFSNVEKYAASGEILEITSQQNGNQTTIAVSDRGPGIPPGQRDKVFQPFYRISNKLSDGVTGTGIGLTIARDLAQLHGGDLILAPTSVGACFQVTLRTPQV